MQPAINELFRAGMSGLLESFESIIKDGFARTVSRAVSLDSHPFKLNIEPGIRHDLPTGLEPLRILFLPDPEYVERSVEAMINVIHQLALRHTAKAPTIRYLRTIHCDIGNGTEDTFFEVGSSHGVFISGGCNDFSRAGNSGKQTLGEIFALFSVIYQVDILASKIPHPESARMSSALFNMYGAHEKRTARLR